MAQTFKGQVLTAATASADHLSASLSPGGGKFGSVQIKWATLTGTVDAAVTVEVSNNGTDWDPLTGASLTLSGTGGHNSILLNGVIVTDLIRVNYAHNSVTGGTIDCWVVIEE